MGCDSCPSREQELVKKITTHRFSGLPITTPEKSAEYASIASAVAELVTRQGLAPEDFLSLGGGTSKNGYNFRVEAVQEVQDSNKNFFMIFLSASAIHTKGDDDSRVLLFDEKGRIQDKVEFTWETIFTCYLRIKLLEEKDAEGACLQIKSDWPHEVPNGVQAIFYQDGLKIRERMEVPLKPGVLFRIRIQKGHFKPIPPDEPK